MSSLFARRAWHEESGYSSGMERLPYFWRDFFSGCECWRRCWRKFTLFNFLGAAVWVTLICGAGYSFGRHWGRVAYDLRRFDLAVSIVVVMGVLLWWWRSRRSPTGSAP